MVKIKDDGEKYVKVLDFFVRHKRRGGCTAKNC